jgi:hypothetical protein
VQNYGPIGHTLANTPKLNTRRIYIR